MLGGRETLHSRKVDAAQAIRFPIFVSVVLGSDGDEISFPVVYILAAVFSDEITD